ncbi:MAG: SMI1/KNR4 family protein [Proteobacteria bacterium]|nr:MAG: SMI1/KNR4 family protein [Pseudomonadota bacterium]
MLKLPNILDKLLPEPQDIVSDFEISRFEKLIGNKLPADYRYYIKNFRGGFLDGYIGYPMIENERSTSGGIDSFFGLNSDDRYSLIRYYTMYCIEQKRMMPGMIPIGQDGGGNYVCLLLSKKDYGKIYFWDHELEVDFDDPGESEEAFRNLYWIADSFTEFANSLSATEE